MSSITLRLLRLRPAQIHHPYPLRHFSSSDSTPPSESQSLRKPISFFKPPSPPYGPFRSITLSRFEYLVQLFTELSEFRDLPVQSPPPYTSPKELYKRHAAPNLYKTRDPSAAGGAKPPLGSSLGSLLGSIFGPSYSPSFGPSSCPSPGPSPGISFGPILDKLRSFRSPPAINQSEPQRRTVDQSVGGGDGLKTYKFSELGAMLQNLRSEKKGYRLSTHELKERLANPSMPRLDLLGQLGGTPSFSPPKDELVEKYFHHDNMSSAEKLKLEPRKVRDEYKISKSHCGSARVQVALLTTKIERLKAVLPKKDKQSRRRIKKLVERRKKWLKFLR